MSVLYERIKRLALEKDMTLKEIERAAGLPGNNIRRWDESVPGADKLAAVAKVLHVSTDYLMGLSDYKTVFEEFDAKYNKDNSMVKKVKEIETIAAHLEDKNITDEKLKALTQYMDLLFDKK